MSATNPQPSQAARPAGRRLRLVCGSFVALLACAALGLAGSASGAGPSDPDEVDGPLDVIALDSTQIGRDLAISFTTAESWSSEGLAGVPDTLADPQSYACFEYEQRQVLRRACLRHPAGSEPSIQVARVNASGTAGDRSRLVSADISRPESSGLRIRTSLDDWGLRPGALKLRAATSWLGAPDCDPVACQDLAPDTGFSSQRIAVPRLIGCRTKAKRVVSRGLRRGKRVALTFDDGPSPYTARVMQILNARKAHGTFYVIGQQARGGRSLLRRMARQGHEIGNHSFRHEIYPGYGSLRSTNRAVRKASGFMPCSFRPPYGAINGSTVAGARRNKMNTVLWSIDTNDWQTPGSGAIYSQASRAGSGSIVLMHDGGGVRSQTVSALPRIVSRLRARGFKLVTVSELLGNTLIWGPRPR